MVGDRRASSSTFLYGIRPPIQFLWDGIRLPPSQYSELLLHLTSDPDFDSDSDGTGACVRELELVVAELTGKEKAIYMPTGTMANQLALRVLAEGKSKVFVQETSHLLNNEGDAAQELQQKRLMPLAFGKANFSLDDMKSAIEDFQRKEIFPTQIGAISIENPVKSKHEQVFDVRELRKIASFATENGIGMHLDGARLHMAAAYTGIEVREYSSYFDTVYIALSKYLGATDGAILCGSADVIDRMPHLIKIHGGYMAKPWGIACVALHFAKSFESRYEKARQKASSTFDELNKIKGIRIDALPGGSNVFKLSIGNGNYERFTSYLESKRNIQVLSRRSGDDFILLKVNESLNYIDTSTLVSSFSEAYSASVN